MSVTIKNQRGINMVELMVTVAITAIGLLGLNSLQLQATRSTQDSGNRSQAIWMLEDMANRIRSNNVSVADYNTGANPVGCNAAPARICTAWNDGSRRIAAADKCSSAEQAASDLWEVSCGFGGNVAGSIATFGSAADFIAGPALTVVPDANNRTTLTLSWDVRTSGTDANGNAIYASNNDNIANRRATITTVIQP